MESLDKPRLVRRKRLALKHPPEHGPELVRRAHEKAARAFSGDPVKPTLGNALFLTKRRRCWNVGA